MTSSESSGRVRALRKLRNMALDQLSGLSGISKASLSKVENGKMSLTFAKLQQLSHGLNVGVSELFHEGRPGAFSGAFGPRTPQRGAIGRAEQLLDASLHLYLSAHRPPAAHDDAIPHGASGADDAGFRRTHPPSGRRVHRRARWLGRGSYGALLAGHSSDPATASISTARWATPTCRSAIGTPRSSACAPAKITTTCRMRGGPFAGIRTERLVQSISNIARPRCFAAGQGEEGVRGSPCRARSHPGGSAPAHGASSRASNHGRSIRRQGSA